MTNVLFFAVLPANTNIYLYCVFLLSGVPQFDFQHAVAVLQDRSSFLQYSGNGRALKAYSGDYCCVQHFPYAAFTVCV